MTLTSQTQKKSTRRGFSMVEMIACVAILGIISFLAIPSLTRMRGESERNLAIARAESLNMAMSTYLQVVGRSQAAVNWGSALPSSTENSRRYILIQPYIAYSESSLALFFPQGYIVNLPRSITAMTKTELRDPNSIQIFY
ncbi:MAG: prepilin-type N-terminal cleavage/methylation domain-containing protein [Verrucomicrobia bacterium]|nr:prepilin-type N-terminal cleavage/methylation domain-containing protein [Verrucomicrobiota bacterium]